MVCVNKRRDKLVQVVIALVVLVILYGGTRASAEEQKKAPHFEINTVLMRSTIKITGKGSMGTGFLLARPYADYPEKGRFTLITAAHVFEDIQGEEAILFMRGKSKAGKWTKLRYRLQIRDGKTPLYVRHRTADVAAIYVRVPENMLAGGIIGTQLLADDDILEKFEVHPGDEVFALGFPFGAEANEAGFPILRSGKIASYPLLPTREVKSFLFDFEVFKGNSGGPVYFFDSNRFYKGRIRRGTVQFVMGLVSEQHMITQKITEPFGERTKRYPLGLGVVVHASLIKETLDLLPLPAEKALQ